MADTALPTRQHSDHKVEFGNIQLTVRYILPEEDAKLYALALEDDWELNISEMRILLENYDECGMGAFTEDGVLVSSFTAVTLDNEFTHFDMFLTKEKFRKKGIGSYMFKYFTQLHRGTQLMFSSRLSASTFYEKRGFWKTNGNTIRAEGIPIGQPCTQSDNLSGINIKAVCPDNIECVLQYDKEICAGDRSKFMGKYLQQGGSYMAMEGGRVQGIIACWKCELTPLLFRVSPFYANSIDTAVALFNRMIKEIQALATGNARVALYFPDANGERVTELCSKFGLSNVNIADVDMTNGVGSLGISTAKIYSITQTVGHYI